MLGKTAGGLLWMARYLERCENTARLVDAGFRIALTRSSAPEEEWSSILSTAAARDGFLARYGAVQGSRAMDFLLRDRDNPSSVLSAIESTRMNARVVRTALTREVWEAVNVCWMTLRERLEHPVAPAELPDVLRAVRQQVALVRGAIHGTMLRNDIYNFLRIGECIERADNTARILDVKYYVLLPGVAAVGSSLDNIQWETILRCTSAERAFGWLHGGESSPAQIAEFLILDRRMPRSLIFCCAGLANNFRQLAGDYGARSPSNEQADSLLASLRTQTIAAIFHNGLHEFIAEFLKSITRVGRQIEIDYRFYG